MNKKDNDERIVQELRKELSIEKPKPLTEEAVYIEVIEVHVIRRKLFYSGDIQFLQDYMDNEDDYEMLYENGFLFDFEDIVGLDIDKFITFVNTYLDDNEDDKDNDSQYGFFQGFKDILKNYRGYTLYFVER